MDNNLHVCLNSEMTDIPISLTYLIPKVRIVKNQSYEKLSRFEIFLASLILCYCEFILTIQGHEC